MKIIVERYKGNPIIKPNLSTSWMKRAVFNAAVGIHKDKFTLIFRGMNELGYSNLGYAASEDGLKFVVNQNPVIEPISPEKSVEDARMTFIDNYWYIQYVSFFPMKVAHIRTKDFIDYERLAHLFTKSNNKNVCLLPKKINDRYGWLHRFDSHMGVGFSIWYCTSENINTTLDNEPYKLVLSPSLKSHPIWNEVKIGIAAPPILTKYGWLLFHHSCDTKRAYQLKLLLLDEDRPWKIIWKQDEPILEAKTWYERMGYNNWCEERDVVFSCGAVEYDNRYWLYYGAADTTVCLAWVEVNDVYEAIEKSI